MPRYCIIILAKFYETRATGSKEKPILRKGCEQFEETCKNRYSFFVIIIIFHLFVVVVAAAAVGFEF